MEMNKKMKRFDEFFPLLGVKDGFIISKRGDLTLGWELELPVAYSLLEAQYDDLARNWASAVKVLPPWCAVHRQDVFLYERYTPQGEEHFLARNYERHFDGREHLIHRSYVFLTFSTKTHVSNSNAKSGLIQTLFPRTAKIKRSVVEEQQSKASEFIGIVTRGGYVSARALTDGDYLGTLEDPGIIQRYLMLGEDTPMMSDIGIQPDLVRVGDRQLMTFPINEVEMLPSQISVTDRVDSMSGTSSEVYLSTGAAMGVLLDCNHIVNQYIFTLPQEATLKSLESKRKRMESGSQRGADNRVGAQEINDFIEDVQTESRTVVKAHCNVMTICSEKERNAVKSKVSTAFSSMDVQGSYNIFDTPVLYYSAIPGAAPELGSDNLMTMELEASLCLGCLETFERDLPDGTFKIADSIRCVPIRIDLQRAAQKRGWIDNYNAFVLGGSGSGKSFYMNSYLRNCYDRGEDVFVIDVGDSYEGVTKVINDETSGKDGMYYSWDREHPLSFNPFIGYSGWLGKNGEINQDEPGVNAFLSSLQTMWNPSGGWNDDMKRVLSRIVTEFVSEDMKTRDGGGSPVFDDFCRYLDENVVEGIRTGKYMVGGVNISLNRFDIDSFLLAVSAYRRSGEFGYLLNDRHPRDIFSNRWSVFEVDKLTHANDKTLYSLVVLWIMESFDMKMRASKDRFKILVIDEAWKAISNESMSAYINALYKTARKFYCSAMVVTQQLSDIRGSAVIKDTIIKNSSVRILLDQSSNQNNFDEIQDMLGMDEIDKNMCLSLNRGIVRKFGFMYKQVFISWGTKKRGVYNTEVSLEEALAYESEKGKKAIVNSRAKDVGSVIEAIHQCAAVLRSCRKKELKDIRNDDFDTV